MTLAEIIERLEKATGPDRELDLAIVKAFGIVPPEAAQGPYGFGYVDKGQWATQRVERLTAGLDAPIALAERVLPGWVVRLWISQRRSACQLTSPRGDDGEKYAAANPALALCLALCRALQAQETPHDE